MIKVRKGLLQDAEEVAAVINSVIAEGKLAILDEPFYPSGRGEIFSIAE